MMQLAGEQTFAQPLAEVWEKLSDVRFLVQCIPGVEQTSDLSETHGKCIVRPGLAFIRGTLEVLIDRIEAQPQERLAFTLASKGVGSSSDVRAQLQLSATDSGSKIHWQAEVVSLGGLLKMVPSGLIRGAAQKVITDVWGQVAAKFGKTE